MPNNKKKITYTKISELSGVSISTISRIINKSPIVTIDTRDKVLSVMQDLGFDTAEYLITNDINASNLIIFNVPTLDYSIYSLMVQGAKASAARHNYNFLIDETEINESSIDKMLDLVKRTKAAGIITASQIQKSILKKLSDATTVVQCCEFNKESDVPFVTTDDVSAAKSAVNHLISLGKRNIAYINGPSNYKSSKERLSGYIESLENSNIEFNQNLVIQLDEINYDMAVSAILQLVNSPNRPDAIFCSSDIYAAAAIKATKKSKLAVPEDIMVVGFEDTEISTMCNPTITTIKTPRYQLGFLSCEMLINKIENNEVTLQNTYLETELLIRESTSLLK